MPVPPPTLPSATGPDFARIERGVHVFGLHVKAVHVVEHAVVGLGDQRIREPDVPDQRREVLVAIHPAERGVAHHADAAGVGDQDRRLEKAGLLHPVRAGHVAVAVQHVVRGEHRIELPAARQDRGDAGADRPLPFDELAFAANQRREADLDAGDIGDGVERSGRSRPGTGCRDPARATARSCARAGEMRGAPGAGSAAERDEQKSWSHARHYTPRLWSILGA